VPRGGGQHGRVVAHPDLDPGPELQPAGEPGDQPELTDLIEVQETALTIASSRPGNSAR
jgi:hypothetical protein